MAVVTKYGTLFIDDLLNQNGATRSADARFARGRQHTTTENFSMTNGDSIASVFYVGRVPRRGVPLPGGCRLEHGTGMPTSVGLGSAAFPNGLLTAYNGSAGAAVKDVSPVIANVGKPFWELLGYASESVAPAEIDLIITLNAAATAACTGYLLLEYSV